MLFRQLVDVTSDRIAYLIACETRRKAVLIDPVAGEIPAYRAQIAKLGLDLVYVLETRAAPQIVSQPYDALLAELGLDPQDQGASGPPAHEILGVPRIGPVSRWRDDADVADSSLVVEAAGPILELLGARRGGPELYRIGGSRPPSLRLSYDRLEVQLGGLMIAVWATGETLSFVLRDRAITGTALASRDGEPVEGPPLELLRLAPDTLLYPTRAPNDVVVSTARQQRACRARIAADWVPAPLATAH